MESAFFFSALREKGDTGCDAASAHLGQSAQQQCTGCGKQDKVCTMFFFFLAISYDPIQARNEFLPSCIFTTTQCILFTVLQIIEICKFLMYVVHSCTLSLSVSGAVFHSAVLVQLIIFPLDEVLPFQGSLVFLQAAFFND